jgi:peptide/nickel transport system substrate-binding protein
MSQTKLRGTHPKVAEAFDLMRRGRMDRREFARIAALLGVSAATAYAMAGVKPAYAADLPFPADDPNAKMGGKIRIGMQVQKMEDPATYDWVQMSNQTRQIVEYMVMTGTDNITRPMLAEKWEASPDLKTWTFTLRKGVIWHNGEEFTSDHVKWNFERWCDPKTASSNIGLSTFASVIEEVDKGEKDDKGNPKKTKQLIKGSFETPDKSTIVIHLTKPVLSVPEDLYNYPTAILHPSFKAPFKDNPIGTGPYRLAELKVGERCVLQRITKTTDGKDFTYWGGKVYLDEIQYIHYEAENQLAAMQSGQVDAIYEFTVDQMDLAKSIATAQIVPARTAQTVVCRMQVDQKPFDNPKIRKALQLAFDRASVKNLVYSEGGDVGEDHHVCPVHPEYFQLPQLKKDIDKSKALLKEAGAESLEVTIDVGNTEGPYQQQMVEAMRDQMAEAGIKLNLNVMPANKYWEIWDKTAFGATSWTHRPLGTMVLSLAYRRGVPWNETHYNNPDFDKALDEAEATLDVQARRAKMEKVEKILQDDAIILQPLWRPIYAVASKKVHGYPAHPTQYHQLNKTWIEA